MVDIALGIEHHGLAGHVELELDALVLLELLGNAHCDLEPVVRLLVSYLEVTVVATGGPELIGEDCEVLWPSSLDDRRTSAKHPRPCRRVWMCDHRKVTHPGRTEHLALVRRLVLLLDGLGEQRLAEPGGGPGLDRDMLLVIESVRIHQRGEIDVREVATDELVQVPVDVLEVLVACGSAGSTVPQLRQASRAAQRIALFDRQLRQTHGHPG